MRHALGNFSRLLVATGAVALSGSAVASGTTYSTVSSAISAPAFFSNTIGAAGALTGTLIGSVTASLSSPTPPAPVSSSFNALPAGITRLALPGQGGTGAAAAPGSPAWNAWFGLVRADVAYNYAPQQSSGNVNVVLGGIDYTFKNNVVLGLAIAGDRTDIALTFAGGSLKGKGTTFSPYLAVPLNKNWTIDGALGWGKTTVDTDVGGTTGRLIDTRNTGSVGITFRDLFGGAKQWMVTGRAAYLAVNDKLGAYTLSNGTFVPDASVKISQMRLGGQAAYNAGIWIPFAGLTYVYDLKAPNNPGAANDRDAFQAALGVKFAFPASFYGSLQYSSELSRSQVKNNQLMLNVGHRF